MINRRSAAKPSALHASSLDGHDAHDMHGEADSETYPTHDPHSPHEALTSDAAAAAVDSWLSVFTRTLALPQRARDDIRSELSSHVAERMRELMLRGVSENDAARRAVQELGDMAELADRFRTAHRFGRRRTIMHALLIGAGAATIVAVAAWLPQSDQPTASERALAEEAAVAEHIDVVLAQVYEAAVEEQQQSRLHELNERVTFSFSEKTLEDALATVREHLGDRGLLVKWSDLEPHGINAQTVVNVTAENVPLSRALDALAAALPDGAAWRMQDDTLELGSAWNEDRPETQLVIYDVSLILQRMQNDFHTTYDTAREEVLDVLQTMVEPWDWEVNGGELAHARTVAGRLFVDAPQSMHQKIEWVLRELSKETEAARAAAAHRPFETQSEHAAAQELKQVKTAQYQTTMLRLREIAQAVQMYADAHNQHTPDVLGDLLPFDLVRDEDLNSPFISQSVGGGYWYGGRIKLAEVKDWSTAIIAFDRAMLDAGEPRVAAAFVDGHVELITPDRVRPLIADASPRPVPILADPGRHSGSGRFVLDGTVSVRSRMG